MVDVIESASTALLTKQRGSGFAGDFDYTLNPYGGCAFACAYCYVPAILRGRAERLGGWGGYVEVRARSVALLARQRHKLTGCSFFCATATDPWQPAERRHGITRGLLELLVETPFRFGLFSTRSPLVLRDLDLLRQMSDRIEVGVSLPTDREDVRRALEPRNPPAAARLETARRLRTAGITVRLHVAPALPATAEFPRVAAEVAEWVWIDWPWHFRSAWVDRYRELRIEEWLRRDRIVQESERWAAALGPHRVKVGQPWFAARWDKDAGRVCRDDNGPEPVRSGP
jgi:DNA repair photolyase